MKDYWYSIKYVIISLLLFVATHKSLSQNWEPYKVVSSLDSLPVENAYVTLDDKLKAVSDSEGYFTIGSDFKYLQISHLAYKPKIISKQDIRKDHIVFLDQNNIELNEVYITNEKKEKITLLPSNEIISLFESKKAYKVNENSIYATYIPNNINKNGLILKIVVELIDRENTYSAKKIMPFRVNLFSVNKETELPDKNLLKKSILAFKDLGVENDLVYIDVEDFSIDLPSEGIFVVVESLNWLELESFKDMSGLTPSFRAIKRKNNSKSITYSRIYSWDRLTKVKDTIVKGWVDKTLPELMFIYNFGIVIECE
ncbi:hypothetical protein [Mangrovimonas futianensis]|uniref:hypothetical protein n=1 Tax=Mangrovimonas futianensis TaxID=2895523 RepID=UPI001E4283EA|nr:hypothetical protein [Mangrovimonas futianensis]MCF1420899.1 hypothetical protein [Mangrovimonas futianensis]